MPMRSWNKGEGPGLAGEVVRFADFLKARGFRVFQSSVHDALRSVQEIDLSRREDFLSSLRVNMAKSDLEWAQFSDLFEEFWERSAKEPTAHPEKMPDPLQRAERTHSEGERVSVLSAQQLEKTEDPDRRAWLEGVAYSPMASVERKDLSRFDRQDIQVAHLALKRMVAPFRIDTSRRSKRSRRHKDVDFPHIMRRSLKTDGIPVTLFYRQKVKEHKKGIRSLFLKGRLWPIS